MALPTNDSAVGHSFGLSFDGIEIKSITDVTGIKMEQDVIEYKYNTAADGKYDIKKLPGRWKAGEMTLTRPLTDNNSFDEWIKNSQLGKMNDVRKPGTLTIYDYEGNTLRRYKFENAWPKTLELGNLKAGDTTVLTEKLTLTYEKCEPE
jgi:phage tail-like protein